METSAVNDQELVVRLAQDDAAAMNMIYDRYWRRLLSLAYMHNKDKSAAKEVVQDILVKLWERRHVQQITNLRGYLGAAVKFSIYHQYLKEQNRLRILNKLFPADPIDANDEAIYAQFLKQQIDDCVDGLPEKCRLVFKFSRNQGKSISQISEEMSIAEKTVEAHLNKALKTVRLSLRSTGWLLISVISFIF